MQLEKSRILSSFFRFVVAKRFWVIAFYALLSVPAIYFSLQVGQDNAPERLMVQTDPDFQHSQRFDQVFGKQVPVVLFFETPFPVSGQALATMAEIQKQLQTIPDVQTNSTLSLYQSLPGGVLDGSDVSAQRWATFALGTDLFAKQSLIDPTHGLVSIQVVLTETSDASRKSALEAVDQTLEKITFPKADISRVRKVGQPYVNDYLDKATRKTGIKSFLLFALFVIVLNWFLYRSVRALIAFILSLGVSTALTIGFIGITGGVFTLVSSLIPMTILITCTATLVYLHSRFVERPKDVSIDEHQIYSLTNKFLACTASIFATAIGFAALFVSKIRPIREMGLWVAIGLVFTWIVVFTLFPALQKALRTPTEQEKKIAGQWFISLAHRLPKVTYRFRLILIAMALVWCGAGAVALFGIPRVLKPMQLQTNGLEYIQHDSTLYKDTKQLEQEMKGGGLSLSELWISRRDGAETSSTFQELALFLAMQDFTQRLEHHPTVHIRAIDYSSILRLLVYVRSFLRAENFRPTTLAMRPPPLSDALPHTQEEWTSLIESLPNFFEVAPALKEGLSRFVVMPDFSQARVSILTKTMNYEEFEAMRQSIELMFVNVQEQHPSLRAFQIKVVGSGPLQAKISHHLVPTLTESFGLTVAIIFLVFLLVFRSGPARIMAMIPSLFAILAMFSIMRVLGMNLNIATILIASTVLGTSENDQIHFFYHYQEAKKDGASTEQALIHTLLVAGRAIFFATLINAGGFLAFALADLPPIRQFGILSSLAFVLSMIADFTALPAALWLVFRSRPDQPSEKA